MFDKIHIKNLSYHAEQKNIIDNLSLSIPMNGITLINGHNGAGKSTLLHMLSGFIKPSSGEIKASYIANNEPNTKEYTSS